MATQEHKFSDEHLDKDNSSRHLNGNSSGSEELNLNKHKRSILWKNVLILSFFHISACYGLYLAFAKAKWQTNMFAACLYLATKVGVGAGVHRLWAHRSYAANTPLRLLLMLLFTIAFEGKVYVWARDHRVHHKHQETDADPYNAGEGLWFSHVGWLLRTKHPMVIEKGRTIDMTDLRADPLVMFQKRYYWPLVFVLSFLVPAALPVWWWAEQWPVAWYVAVCLRCVVCFHGTWVINSIAHAYGNRPYDKNLMAAENPLTSYVTLGEGWHNYHHAFPWDYRTSEWGLGAFNVTKGFIDLCAAAGWAHDLRTASPALVEARARRTGDGTRRAPGVDQDQDKDQDQVWGWGDRALSCEERRAAIVQRRKTDGHVTSSSDRRSE